MGTLDKSSGTNVARKIKFVDITDYNITQIENAFNNNYGNKGWKIVQVILIGNKTYLLAEKEI